MRNQTTTIAAALLVLLSACGEVTSPENGGNPADGPTIESLTPDRVPLGGGTVTVGGSGFTEDMTIVLGTRSIGDFTVSSDAELVLTVPPGTLPDDPLPLTLVTDSGLAFQDDAITYNMLPTVATSRPPIVALAGGTAITITGSLFEKDNEGPVTVTLGGTALTNVTVVDDQTITATVPSGAASDVGVAQDLVVETHNGSASLPEAHTYISPGGLLFGQPRERASGIFGITETDESIGIYYVDPATKMFSFILQLHSGIGDMLALPSGGIGVRFSRNGSVPYGRSAIATLDLQEGTVRSPIAVRPSNASVEIVRLRTMTSHNGVVYAIGEIDDGVCCGSPSNFGRLNPATGEFTVIAATQGSLDSESCIVPGLTSTTLTAIRFSNPNMQTINTNSGLVADGSAFTGDLTLPNSASFPKSHGAARVGNTIYAIQYFRNNNGQTRLVTVSATGEVTFVADLPDGAAGLVALP